MIVIWRFRITAPEYDGEITRGDIGKGGQYGLLQMTFFTDSNTSD